MSSFDAPPEELARHPLPQATLSVPLFLGVEAAVVGFEVIVLAFGLNLTGLALAPSSLLVVIVAGVHSLLALATRRDRRITMVFGRSFAYGRLLVPWPTLATVRRVAEPTFPRRLLT